MRTGLEELVGASVVDPVEHHTWTIELSVGVGVAVPNSALVGPVQCSVRPGQLLHCKVTTSIDVYQRLDGPGPFHSLGDFEVFVALLFHSRRRQYPLSPSSHGPSVPSRSTGESQPQQPCPRTHERAGIQAHPSAENPRIKPPTISDWTPGPWGQSISRGMPLEILNHTLYSGHPTVRLG